MKIRHLAVTAAAFLPAVACAQLGDDSAYGRAAVMIPAAASSAAGASTGQGATGEAPPDHGLRWSSRLDEPASSRAAGAPAPQADFAADRSTPLGDPYRANGL